MPIEVTRSNVEATKEDEELLGSAIVAGHSVWFEWEATLSGWVTIGSCDADFAPAVGVYTGTAVDALTRVAEGNASEGPDCPFSQRQYTFKAVSGTKYEIVVDGNPFSAPEGPPADTEGAFRLRIEATPPPSNDDFDDALVLSGEAFEEPNGARFLYVSETGYNWGATKEADEPSHRGDPGGASVWYSWTAPESGFVRIGVCCGGPRVVGVYLGSSVESLTPLDSESTSPSHRSLVVSGGTTYRIAVDGVFDAGVGEAETGSFNLGIFLTLVSRPIQQPLPQGSVLAPDVTPPNTTIRRRVLKRKPPIRVFSFASTEPGSTFQCKIDKRPFRKCGSSKTFRRPRPGRHTLRVRAIDPSGNVDRTPAVARFRGPR